MTKIMWTHLGDPTVLLWKTQNIKNPNIDNWVPKLRFSKMYIFGAPIESEGPGMVSS